MIIIIIIIKIAIKEIPCGAGSPHSMGDRGGEFDCISHATAINCSAEGEYSFSAGDYRQH